MKNYTERLKKYWKSNDLTFIAKFKKVNNHGYFNHLINPENQNELKYPVIDEIEVVDNRVSFYYGKASELIDGGSYKIELTHTDHPKGKNNPYSLKIEKISLLSPKKGVEGNENDACKPDIFYGCYKKSNDYFAAFENVIHSESGEVLTDNGEPKKVFVSPNLMLKNKPIEEDAYYAFSIKENIGKLPSAIPDTIEELKFNPYQKIVQSRFERHNNPDSNRMIAQLMEEIGKGLYSSKQRMIFELLQNADDAPGKKSVEFHIDASEDYLFLMHDGAPFNKKDVIAISSAAQSTKRTDLKKTGYKGIGFKSVFTDSTEVWIKSGGFQFAFLINCPFYDDFDKFYFSRERYKKHPDILEEDKRIYAEERANFNRVTDIPWQIIPVWQASLPPEFHVTNYDKFQNPVQIALKLGGQNIFGDEGYLSAINNIVKRPQFILFLRNTSKFRSPKNGVTILKQEEKDSIRIIKSKKDEQEIKLNYTKLSYLVPVSNETFDSYGIDLEIRAIKNKIDKLEYQFTNKNGNVVKTVPPKLAAASITEISFGISLVDNKISPEKEYLQGIPKYSSLFTYLPMEDTRFQLPFLVNADFVPSSDRQKIQGDNLWNKYIMIKVAEKHIATLSNFAQQFVSDNNANASYLSLLLMNPLPEDDTAQQMIDSYNDKYLEQLKIQNFIVNDHNKTQLLSETILDLSGLVELFGYGIFYEIIDTEKRLPHPNLDANYLKKYNYLEVETIDLEELAKHIIPEICDSLENIIAKKSLYDKPELLRWLNKLVKHIPDNFGKIPFIFHNNALFSLERLVVEKDAWLINKNTSENEELIRELGYHTINLDLDKYSNISNYLLSLNGYINDKTLAYERIAANSNLPKLPIATKLKLVDFLRNSEFMVGIGEKKYFGELELFVDEKGKPRPLNQLLSRKEEIEITSLHQFRIDEKEFKILPEGLKKELIEKEKVFTSFILDSDLFKEWSRQFSCDNINTYIDDLRSVYTWVANPDEISSADWASIPWLYINEEARFISADKVYWSNAFYKLSEVDYDIIKLILHKAEIKILPLQTCGEIIQIFKLKTDDSSGIDWTKINDIETLPANTFLDWLENDGSFSDFFEEFVLESNENGLWSISEIDDTQTFDGANKELTNYIQFSETLKSLFTELDQLVCSENRNKIGLLQGDKLLRAIIDSGAYDQNLAVHLPSNISWDLLHKFISNLAEFNLKTGIEYNVSSPEHIAIHNLLRTVEDINLIPNEVLKTIENLRAKIKINNNPLSVYDLSNRIQFGKGNDRKVLNLSDVLEEFKGESEVLDNLIESFVSITDKRKLRRLIFKTRQMHHDDICSKIEAEVSVFYSVHQVVFQLLYKDQGGQKHWSKQNFADYWKSCGNNAQLHASYKSFLDLLLDLNFTGIINFQDLELKNYVDKNYAIESEVLPQWLMEWVYIDQDKRLDFISKLGYNGINSPIVKLRQNTVLENYDQNTVIRFFEEAKPNARNIWNSIIWLSRYSSQIVSRNIFLIKQINDYISHRKDVSNSITIPIIESIDKDGSRRYNLSCVQVTSKLYILNLDEEYADIIFSSLKRVNEKSIIIDGNCGKKSSHFNTEVIQLNENVDHDLLERDSKPWDEIYYKKWEYHPEYPIYIFNGNEIPYKRTFNDVIIKNFTKDLKVVNNGKYFVSNVLIRDVLNNLPPSFPKEMLINLKEWHYKTLQNESLLDEDSFDYKENIDRLLQDRLGISEEDQKRESGNAKTHAVYFLDENGFDVSSVNNAGATLTNIIDPDGNQVTCIVRSAKGGLLYLDKEHWDMLADSLMYLLVIYPGNNPRLFKSRLELLDEELSKNVLFRVPNTKKTSEIDDVFGSLESESHLILITSEKMRESLFSKLRQNNDFKKEEDAAVGGDSFTF